MIKSIWQYLVDEIKPRWLDIVFGSEFILAATFGVLVALKGDKVLLGSVKMEPISMALLTYSAIALGFCIAGLTLVLTLPNSEFTKKMAISKVNQADPRDRNAYSDLLFVLSWSAVSHWLIIIAVILAVIFNGFDTTVFTDQTSEIRRIGIGVTAFISLYGLFQFLIVLITLSQVGRLYVNSIKK